MSAKPHWLTGPTLPLDRETIERMSRSKASQILERDCPKCGIATRMETTEQIIDDERDPPWFYALVRCCRCQSVYSGEGEFPERAPPGEA